MYENVICINVQNNHRLSETNTSLIVILPNAMISIFLRICQYLSHGKIIKRPVHLEKGNKQTIIPVVKGFWNGTNSHVPVADYEILPVLIGKQCWASDSSSAWCKHRWLRSDRSDWPDSAAHLIYPTQTPPANRKYNINVKAIKRGGSPSLIQLQTRDATSSVHICYKLSHSLILIHLQYFL